MLVLEFLILGSGISMFLISSAVQSASSFLSIAQGALAGAATVDHVISFIINVLITFGMLFAYYFIAYLISKLIIRD